MNTLHLILAIIVGLVAGWFIGEIMQSDAPTRLKWARGGLVVGLWLIALALIPSYSHAAELSKADLQREAIYQTLAFVDWRQTRDFNGRHSDQFREVNPILGEHPNAGQINRYFIISGLLHYAVTRVLPEKYRVFWQGFTIGVESQVVGHNIQIGVHTTF